MTRCGAHLTFVAADYGDSASTINAATGVASGFVERGDRRGEGGVHVRHRAHHVAEFSDRYTWSSTCN